MPRKGDSTEKGRSRAGGSSPSAVDRWRRNVARRARRQGKDPAKVWAGVVSAVTRSARARGVDPARSLVSTAAHQAPAPAARKKSRKKSRKKARKRIDKDVLLEAPAEAREAVARENIRLKKRLTGIRKEEIRERNLELLERLQGRLEGQERLRQLDLADRMSLFASVERESRVKYAEVYDYNAATGQYRNRRTGVVISERQFAAVVRRWQIKRLTRQIVEIYDADEATAEALARQLISIPPDELPPSIREMAVRLNIQSDPRRPRKRRSRARSGRDRGR